MRVCFNRRAIKPIFVIVLTVAAIILVLKLVALWDSKQGAVDVDQFQSTVPTFETETQSVDILVREPTDKEREELANGNITTDELIQNLVDDAVVVLPDNTADIGESEQPPGTDQEAPQAEKPAKSEFGQRIAEIVAEVYVLRDEYIIELEHMYQEAEASLSELVESGNKEGMTSLIRSYLTKANELELQCDKKIDAIVAEMKDLISDNGGDMTPVDTIIETYINEKATKKAWYIERLKEKGLIS